MAFSKKVESNSTGTNNGGGSTISGEQWDTWNEMLWDALDVTPITGNNGKEIKEVTEIGVVNFIMEIGSQPNQFITMVSTAAAPEGDEEFSQAELAIMETRKSNTFFWDTEYRDGKSKKVRKVQWPIDPEEELVLAMDFPNIKIDYSKHPAANGVGEIKPLRIDYNGEGKGKFRGNFNKKITNEVNYKTGKFSPKDIKYKIAQASGVLEAYQSDGHDLAHLVQTTCNYQIVATKNVDGDRTYYDMSIKNPTMIQDIKTRKDTYTVEEQLADASCDVPFCGILMNGGEYPEENLKQIRNLWKEKAKSAVTFDRNEGTTRDGEWICGLGYEGSDLQKALTAFETKLQGDKPAPKQTPPPKAAAPKKVAPEPVPTYNEPPMDFDDK